MNTLPSRKPNRIPNFDYSSINFYFFTVCAKDKQHHFGRLTDSQFIPNQIGKIIDRVWNELTDKFAGIELDCFQTMPNHVHGIIALNHHPLFRAANTPAGLGQIIGAFKAKVNLLTRQQIFPKRHKIELWQKTYYDRVIRNEQELLETREYIVNNPAKWELDEYYWKRAGTGA